MKRHMDEELNGLREKVLYMGSLAEEMIHFSIKSLIDRKDDLCQQVFDREETVNRLQMEIDEMTVRMLALYQPEASDLRSVMSSMKINAELERVADQAVNVAQTCYFHLNKETPARSLLEIPRMAQIAVEMIKECLDAYSKRDIGLAQAVLKSDEELDILKAKALNEVVGMIRSHPNQAKQFIDMILIAKNLEKIGDHATNIAEDVIFMVQGKDIRHHAQETPAPQA